MDNGVRWQRNFDALKIFEKEYGHTKVPSTFETQQDGTDISLGTWVAYMRTKYRKGILTTKEINYFETLKGWSWNPGKPGPTGDPKRDKEIMRARQSGARLQEIADRFNISRQRVHQIVEQSRRVKV